MYNTIASFDVARGTLTSIIEYRIPRSAKSRKQRLRPSEMCA